MKQIKPYQPKHKIRIVTAASLFDGHDASINIMRRIIQSTGVEVIHLGHDRSVEEVVNTAIQEDVNAICLTSYQGGHNEYFKYMYDLLKERGSGHIKIFGGGGGVILPSEIKELMDYGISRIYSPDDGREMGLQGMINDLVEKSDFAIGDSLNGEVKTLANKNPRDIARVISSAENFPEVAKGALDEIHKKNKNSVYRLFYGEIPKELDAQIAYQKLSELDSLVLSKSHKILDSLKWNDFKRWNGVSHFITKKYYFDDDCEKELHQLQMFVGKKGDKVFVGCFVAKKQDANTDAVDEANLEVIQVSGIRGSLQRAQAIKMSTDNIVEVLSAEDIGKLPDSSIAESLARLPGLSGERVGDCWCGSQW